jgi:hypothetical protein
VTLSDSAKLVVSGGYIQGVTTGIEVMAESTFTMVEGTVVALQDGVTTVDRGRTELRGGRIIGQIYGVDAHGSGTVDMFGGTVVGAEDSIVTSDSAILNWLGGHVGGSLRIEGGTLNVYGRELSLTDSRLTGFLVDGTAIDHAVSISGDGRVVLHADGGRHPGDFNRNHLLDAADVASLETALRDGSNDPLFDLNLSGRVELTDLTYLLFNWLEASAGDSNVDRRFDSADLVAVFSAGQFEDRVTRNSTWTTGDWNGDREFDTADLVLAFQSSRYESDFRLALVPELTLGPLTLVIMMSFAVCTSARRRK